MNLHEVVGGANSSDRDRIDLWTRVLRTCNAEHVAELGVWRGEFAEQILSRCGSVTKYYMVDPWAPLPDWNKPYNVKSDVFDNVYSEAMRRTEFAAQKRSVLRGRTQEVLGVIPDESLDFGYIDGDHTLRGITIDLIRLYPKIKEGGLIGGDDFKQSMWQHGAEFEPTLVCPYSVYFAEAMDIPIVALPFDQFLIQKRSGASFEFIDPTGKVARLSVGEMAKHYQRVVPTGRFGKLLHRIGFRTK